MSSFKDKKVTKKQMVAHLKNFCSRIVGSGSIKIEEAINTNRYDKIKKMYSLIRRK